MKFGAESEKSLVMDGFGFKIQTGGSDENVVIHNEKEPTGTLTYMLSRMTYPENPVPVGVFRNIEKPVYHEAVHAQVNAAKAKGKGDLSKLFNSGSTWTVA
jgi:2-oxoglutarate ferredoxin oxidoreductase subunit beta